MSYSVVNSIGFGDNNWCLKLLPLDSSGLLASVSDGAVHLMDWNDPTRVIREFKVADLPVSGLSGIVQDQSNEESGPVFAAASVNKVKVFDVRTGDCQVMEHESGSNILSLGSGHGMLAYGTELQGADAEVHLYDVRNFTKPIRSFIDSHHDDVTDIKFHPTSSDLLMSGSTDGYTNIYDLKEAEEDDALHQVINYASIHSCGWLAPRRIYTLSHMETFAIHELNDKTEELTEPQPLDFGDVREPWGCDYVVDVYPGRNAYIATGRTQENAGELKIIPFKDESPLLEQAITIPQAHGDDVVRDTLIRDRLTLYTCGEDGYVRVWQRTDTELSLDLGSSSTMTTTPGHGHPGPIPADLEKPSGEDKKSKKHAKKKHSQKPRFKPY